MKRALLILGIDSFGGLVVGCLVQIFAPWLSDVYGWPASLVRFNGIVNLAYGSYSGLLVLILWIKHTLDPGFVRFLIVANLSWTVVCILQVIWLQNSSTVFGIAVLLMEGAYVGILALIERKLVLPFLEDRLAAQNKLVQSDDLD